MPQLTEVSFQNGALTLRGVLTLPDGPGPHPALVVAHGAAIPQHDAPLYRHLADLLAPSGIAVMSFDRRGHGESGGNFESASFDDLASDLLAALDFLGGRSDMDAARLGLWGLSQGGWLAPLAASKRPSLAFVIAVSASGVGPGPQMDYSAAFALRRAGFDETAVAAALALRSRVNDYYRGQAPRGPLQRALDEAADQPWFTLGDLPEELPADPTGSKWALELAYDPLPTMRSLQTPLLLIYGEVDPWIPIDDSIARWQEHRPRTQALRRIPDANHFMISVSRAGVYADEGPIVPAYAEALSLWLAETLSAA